MTQRQTVGSYDSIGPRPRPRRKLPPGPESSSSGLKFTWYLERSGGTSRASDAPIMGKVHPIMLIAMYGMYIDLQHGPTSPGLLSWHHLYAFDHDDASCKCYAVNNGRTACEMICAPFIPFILDHLAFLARFRAYCSVFPLRLRC